jgi:hypothetical protein
MIMDATVLAIIAAPIIALFVGVWVNRKFESRPILYSYFGHISAFRSTPPNQAPIQVHTHAVILRNAGRRSATNIRITHKTLPDFSIWPSISYRTETLPDGASDIIIPTLVPGEQVTISYLYFPPLTALNINAGIKYDQGFAKQIPVLLQRQFPKWINLIVGALLIMGIISVVYLFYTLIVFLIITL